MNLGEQLWRKRLSDWEAFDRITFEVVPRYKTSGLSGDEWRQHVEVTFWHKGEAVFAVGYRDMEAALMLTPADFIRQQEPIPEAVIDIDKTTCDQPSCAEKAIGRLRIKEEFGDRGQKLHEDEMKYHTAYRQFCKRHIRRGDCSREDSDDNYEPMDGVTADSSTNLEESPSRLTGVVEANSPAELAAAIERIRREAERK